MLREDWEQAAEEGHITPEHVLQRLENILTYAEGNEGPVDFDEDGHVIALVAWSKQMEGGYKLRVWPRDHPPPHAHIELRLNRRRSCA
ncbi:hypothetical protein Rwratislav_23294 [Rhodococcus wratislaviensis IFP 2016]|nr:hypothetical protein Rwratislav_23294 [Rhodococcus wratislaviensis IFP 2016]